MSENSFLKNSQIFLLGISISLATIFSTVILSQALIKMKKFSEEVITVTGSAEKNITSDLMVWRADFSRRDAVMTTAYAMLGEDQAKVREYLITKGVKAEEMTFLPVQTGILYKKSPKGTDTNEIEAYLLSQRVEVRSEDVQRVTEISRHSTELITYGIQFISQAPEYFYTKLAELKLEMLARATENSRERARNMAAATGSHIGFMRSARMGVFQITPVNSFEVSDWGTNDTTSLVKKVTAVVNVAFTIGS